MAENQLRDRINNFFDVLELIVVRLTLLALAIIGAYYLIHGHISLAH
jgi:hypothetical protein